MDPAKVAASGIISPGNTACLASTQIVAYGGRMQLTDDDLREFADLWQAEFSEILSTDEARHHAAQLLQLYAVLAESSQRPLHEHPNPTSP